MNILSAQNADITRHTVRCRVICLRQSLAWESQEAQNADNFKYRTKVSNAGLKHDPTKSTENMKWIEIVGKEKMKMVSRKKAWAGRNPLDHCPSRFGGFNTAVKMQFRRNELKLIQSRESEFI